MKFRLGLALAAALGAAAPATADAAEALFARARAIALAERCALSSEGARSALAVGRLTARGALIRAGASPHQLDALEAEAEQAAFEIDCADERAVNHARNIDNAYNAWRHLRAMEFPASERSWAASRPYDSQDFAWMLRQDIDVGAAHQAAFGMARLDGETTLAVAVSGLNARSARLYVRDAEDADGPPSPLTARLGGARDGLALRAWPDAFTTPHWAAGRVQGETVAALCEGWGEDAVIFRFDTRAQDALAALDPRESVYLEFDVVADNGEIRPERSLVEVGDFAAALLFVTAES